MFYARVECNKPLNACHLYQRDSLFFVLSQVQVLDIEIVYAKEPDTKDNNMLPALILASLLVACGDKDTDKIVDTSDTEDTSVECVDDDNDLSCIEDDCNDSDPLVRPGAYEIWYDSVDQNCDGANDYDQDGDGFDHDLYGGTDCDDTRASVNSEAEEINGDTYDNNCNGHINKRSYTVDYDMSTGDLEIEVCDDPKITAINAVYFKDDPSEWVEDETIWEAVTLNPGGWGNCEEDKGELIIKPPVGYNPSYVMLSDGGFTAMGMADNINCLIWGEHAQVAFDLFKKIGESAGYVCEIYDPTTY